MDNLTHSLVGALLGQAGLKRLSGRAMPTLIIAANIPDIDAVAMLLGTEGLAIRRGITHGPLAMLLLPPLVTALVLAWNHWRPLKQGPPVRPAMLLLLAYVGTLSHPALDWLNSYGIRLLEPFSGRWSYGDTLFIIDLWVWLALILGFWISRRRERRGRTHWRTPAVAALGAVAAYVGINGLITARAEWVGQALLNRLSARPTEVVANPVPLRFWERQVLWRTADEHGNGEFDALATTFRVHRWLESNNLSHPAFLAARSRDDVQAFLLWSRMPIVVEVGEAAYLTDQRFYSDLRDQGTGGRRYGYDPFTVPLDTGSRSP